MNRIDSAFKKLKAARKTAFIAYVTAGDPDLKTTQDLILCLEQNGADVIELGVPFSDPLADGLVNQRAAQRALRSGTTLVKIFAAVRRARRRGAKAPLVLFTYFNPVHRMGLETFARRAAQAGVDGALLLDLPPEEAQEANRLFRKHRLRMIVLIAPTTGTARMARICRRAQGFVYCVSRTGVTGAKTTGLQDAKAMTRRVKRCTRVPVAVGFGINSPEQVRQLRGSADGIVVGSALVAEIEKHRRNPVDAVARLTRKLTKPLNIH